MHLEAIMLIPSYIQNQIHGKWSRKVNVIKLRNSTSA